MNGKGQNRCAGTERTESSHRIKNRIGVQERERAESVRKKRKIIVINGRFLLHRVTGVERYARELVSALDRIVPAGQFEMAVPPEAEDIPVYRNIQIRRVGKLHNRLWEHVSFPAYVKRRGGIALNLCNVAPLPAPGIATVHDVKPIVHPEYYSRKFVQWYRLLYANEFRRARMILTGSKFSAREIIRFYHVRPQRIHLIPDGWQHYERVEYDPHALERYGLEKGAYYFSLGSNDPGKNLSWILESARLQPDITFAVSGNVNKTVFADSSQGGVTAGESRAAKPDNVRLLGYVTDEEAKTLMRDCRAFLFPSFYEGFGIPPLEALSAGCPCVVVSDIPVMHEIFGENAVYIDPNRPGDFSWKKVDGQNVLARYSWDRSARKLLRVLERSNL